MKCYQSTTNAIETPTLTAYSEISPLLLKNHSLKKSPAFPFLIAQQLFSG